METITLRKRTVLLFVSLAVTVLSVQAQTATPWQTGTYVYDGAGNIKSIGTTEQYRYDALGRFRTGTIATGQAQSATYDSWGNVKSLTTDGASLTIGVDRATNRAVWTVDPDTGVPYNIYAAYDNAGRLTMALNGAGGTFAYDAADAVMKSTVDGVSRVHLYTASDERIASVTFNGGMESVTDWTLRDASGRVLRRLQKNGSTWLLKEDYIYASGQMLAGEVDTAIGTLHYFPDHLGTPRLITGNGGAKVALHTYFPFGAEATSPLQDAEKLKFSGHERDSDNLDYMHARYFAPKWGRFLSVDPGRSDLKNPQSWNRYSYTMNDPINNSDPDGRETNPVTGQSYILDSQILVSKNNPRKGFFGMVRRNPDGTAKKHGGNDIAAPRGTPVFAPVTGTVVQSGKAGGDGGYVLRIRRANDENGKAVYVHISHLNGEPNVKVGDKVVEGQPNVAEVGNTGNARNEPPHAHTAVMVGGQTKEDQVDPQQWFRDHPSTAQPKPEEKKEPCEASKPC